MARWLISSSTRRFVTRTLTAIAVTALGAVAGIVLTGTPALADATISLDAGASAIIAGTDTCAQPDAVSGRALWTFEVRDTALASAGELVAFAATFLTPSGQAAVEAHATPVEDRPTADPTPTSSAEPTTPPPASGLDGRRAWVSTPPQWQLATASAEVTGTAGYLELVGFCSAADPATGAPPTTLPSVPVTATTKRPMLLAPTAKDHRSSRSIAPQLTTPAPTVALHAPAARSALPVTGTDVGGMLALGTSLLLAGILLLIVRRQRMRAANRPVEDAPAIVVTWRE